MRPDLSLTGAHQREDAEESVPWGKQASWHRNVLLPLRGELHLRLGAQTQMPVDPEPRTGVSRALSEPGKQPYEHKDCWVLNSRLGVGGTTKVVRTEVTQRTQAGPSLSPASLRSAKSGAFRH